MRTGRPHTLPPGPYADLAAKIGGVVKLAEALHVDRGTITRAAEAGRWLSGGPAVKMKTLCDIHKIKIPVGMLPGWLVDAFPVER